MADGACADHLWFFSFRRRTLLAGERMTASFEFRDLQPASRHHDKQGPRMQRRSGTSHTSSAQSRQSPSKIPPFSHPCPRHSPRMKSRALPFMDIQERGFRDLVNGTSIKDAEGRPGSTAMASRRNLVGGDCAVSRYGTLLFSRFLPSPSTAPLPSSLNSHFCHADCITDSRRAP